jgi:two-component system, NtrC family, sensor kinase
VVELGLRKDNMKVVRSGWEIVSRNLERIHGLTTNMLAYSKQRKPELEMTSLPKLLDEVVALVQGQFDGKNAALITDWDPDMPPVPLDPGGVHQAVLNLLNNGLDAVEPESGAVSLRCEYEAAVPQIRLQVTDNGRGIEPERLGGIFEPFQSTKGQRGTGLGLVVTKKIAEEHGGSISVESSPTQGTTFTVLLPVVAGPLPASGDTHGPNVTTMMPEDE